MKSQGEIEAAVCDGISRFQQEFIGRGPRDIHAHLVGTLLVVRLQGVLTAAERQLLTPREDAGAAAAAPARDGDGDGDGRQRDRAGSPDGRGIHSGGAHSGGNGSDNGNGRSLLKQVRAHMVATGRPRLEQIVCRATGVGMVSVHHDISTITGEEVLVFSLAQQPACRVKKSAK